jgi:hypothetical protein
MRAAILASVHSAFPEAKILGDLPGSMNILRNISAADAIPGTSPAQKVLATVTPADTAILVDMSTAANIMAE